MRTFTEQKKILTQARKTKADKVVEAATEYYTNLVKCLNDDFYLGDLEDVKDIMNKDTSDEVAFKIYSELDTLVRENIMVWCVEY